MLPERRQSTQGSKMPPRPMQLARVLACVGAFMTAACDKPATPGPEATVRADAASAAPTAEPSTAAAEPSATGTDASAAAAPPTSAGVGSATLPGTARAGASAASAAASAVAEAPAPAASSSAPEAPPAPPVEGEKKTGAQYAAFLSGPKKVKAGSTVGLSAIFTASGNYHCNEKYPTSFKPDAAPEGVTFASDKFASASFSAKRSSVPVTLTASTPGSKRVSGTLKFGVCDESECIPVKVPVAFAFDVE
jgi:hypothetical protein